MCRWRTTHVRVVHKRQHSSGAADAESLCCDLPDDDECEFCDCSDSVQESHGPNIAEAGSIGHPPGGLGTPEEPDGDVLHQTADEAIHRFLNNTTN